MKTLWEEDGVKICIQDKDNYTVRIGEDISYHNKLDSAVRDVARRGANENAYNLKSWLADYRKTIEYLCDVMEGKA